MSMRSELLNFIQSLPPTVEFTSTWLKHQTGCSWSTAACVHEFRNEGLVTLVRSEKAEHRPSRYVYINKLSDIRVTKMKLASIRPSKKINPLAQYSTKVLLEEVIRRQK